MPSLPQRFPLVRSFAREALTTLSIKLLSLLPLEALDRLRREAASRTPEAPRREPTHRVRGRLLFLDAERPLQHMEVELWERDLGAPDDFLGRGTTDSDGGFTIAYDPSDAGPGDVPDLDLRVVELTRCAQPGGGSTTERRVVHVVHGPDDVSALEYDFGTCRVPYWSYRQGSPVARVATGEGLADALPQDFSAARKSQGYSVVSEVSAIRLQHLQRVSLGRPPTLSEVQRDYPLNRTLEVEREAPGRSRSDAWFVDRMLNGFNPALFRVAPDGSLYVEYSYEGYELDDRHFAPDVRAYFERRGGELVPTKITLRRRRPGAPPGDPVEYTPADGATWERAMRVVRVSYALWGEVEAHLARAHLNVEQYAIAAFRNLRRSPIARLLLPHLRETVVINHRAATSLLGPEGFVVVASALTQQGVEQMLLASVGACDWAGWSPRAPVTGAHTFAKAGRLYWQVVGEWVARFFTENAVDIAASWSEVVAMSRDLVEHSAPHVAPRGGDPWLDASELNDHDELRREVAGVRRAVSEVTASAAPDAEGLGRLQQLCRYVIFHATFFHSWANDEQHADGGEAAYLSLGLDADVLDDPGADGLSAFEATTQLFFTWYLTRTRYGLVTRNEEGDIEPGLIAQLKTRRGEFAALGYDIDAIRSRINV